MLEDTAALPNRRERKKLRTFAAIVEAAKTLFGDVGYHATSMEAIAEAAGVSAGTVYNYFGTKSTILAAVVTEDMDEILHMARDQLDLEASRPVDALMPTLEVYLNNMTAYGPDVLKALFRAGFDPAQTELLVDLVSSDERVLVQLSESLGAMRSRGLVSSETDIEGAALLVYSIVAVALIMFASIPGATRHEVVDGCRVQLGMAFVGLAAR